MTHAISPLISWLTISGLRSSIFQQSGKDGFVMKQLPIVCMGLILALLTTCSPQQMQTIGSDKYYVKIQDEGEKYTEQGNSRYKYELEGFNEDGEGKNLEFTSNHQLKDDAYLRIYYKKGEVITYEEVESDDIPKDLQQLLEDDSDS